jgi:DNA-binding response OmpR family regulator
MSQPSSGVVRVLAVFATSEDRTSLSQLFRDFRWKVQFVDSSGSLEDAFREFRPDVVLTDSVLPAGECWKDVLRSARERSGELPVIVSSRLADERLWAEVLNLGGYDLLVKPFVASEVQNVVCMACRAHHRELVMHAGCGLSAFPVDAEV